MQSFQNKGSVSQHLLGEHWTLKAGELCSEAESAPRMHVLRQGSGGRLWSRPSRLPEGGCLPCVPLHGGVSGVGVHGWTSQQPAFQAFPGVGFLSVSGVCEVTYTCQVHSSCGTKAEDTQGHVCFILRRNWDKELEAPGAPSLAACFLPPHTAACVTFAAGGLEEAVIPSHV